MKVSNDSKLTSHHPRIVIQNRSPEPTKKKIETLVKRFLKKDAKFQNDSKLTSYHSELSSKIEAQNLQKRRMKR